MKHIIEILKEFPEVCNYKISQVQTSSYETFFVHKQLETVRATDTTDTSVTVYVLHDGKMGDSVFSVYASTTESELRAKIALAVEKAQLVNNQPYDLPAGETLCEQIPSNIGEMEPKELAKEIARACFDANDNPNGSLNALEIFVNKVRVHIVNGNGLDKCEQKYNCMVEAIPTWTDGESVELYECYNFSTFSYDDVKAEIAGKMQEVRDRYYATKPQINPNCTVVLNAPEIASLLWEITGELGYGSVYSHSNAYKKGDNLQNGDCDKLTVTMCGKIEGSHRNSLFDGDGVTLQDTVVIQDGVAVNYYGSNRFGQYLGEKVTGVLPCMQVSAGSVTEDDLGKEPYFECVSMSGLQVDVYNDYIGGEVRLAYYFDGTKKVALTGISISGKLSEALATLRLTDKIVTSNSYRGPHKALFGKIAVI